MSEACGPHCRRVRLNPSAVGDTAIAAQSALTAGGTARPTESVIHATDCLHNRQSTAAGHAAVQVDTVALPAEPTLEWLP